MISRTDLEGTLRADGSDTVIDVWVIPGARRSGVAGIHDGALRVRVGAPPEGGRANKAVLALLGELLPAHLSLEGGSTSRRKKVRVEGRSPEAVATLLVENLAARG